MTMHQLAMATCALLALSCAAPHTGSIEKALDEGDHEKAALQAVGNAASLDALAMEILARGVADEQTRRTGLQLLSRSRSRSGDLIEDLAATSDDPLVRTWARALVTQSGDTGYAQSLTDGLESEDGEVRRAALSGLLAIRSDRAFMEEQVLDPHPQARLAVVRKLVSMDTPWADELLLAVAATDPVDSLRAAALWGLDADDPQHREVLVEALDADTMATRVTAARILGRTDEGVQAARAAGALEEGPTIAGIHLAAAALGAGIEAQDVSAYLARALGSDDETLRTTALGALAGQRVSVPAAESLYADSSRAVRLAWCRLDRVTANAMPVKRVSILTGSLAEEGGLDVMVGLAEEGRYEDVRAQVWWILETGDPSRKRYVLSHASRPFHDPTLAISAMTDDDPVVRLHAAASWLTR